MPFVVTRDLAFSMPGEQPSLSLTSLGLLGVGLFAFVTLLERRRLSTTPWYAQEKVRHRGAGRLPLGPSGAIGLVP